MPPSNAKKIALCSNIALNQDRLAAIYERFCYSFPMSDTLSLADQINRLATALTANADLIPFQRRVLASLEQIEAILGRGVPLRRLATALANAGLQDGAGQPLSESHFRAAVSRARSRQRQSTTMTMATPVSPPKPPKTAQQADISPAAKRPDFSGGLFDQSDLPGRKPHTKG